MISEYDVSFGYEYKLFERFKSGFLNRREKLVRFMVVRVEYDRSNRSNRSSHAVAHRRVGSRLTLVQQIPSPLLPSLPLSPSLPLPNSSTSLLLLPFLPFLMGWVALEVSPLNTARRSRERCKLR